MNPAVPFIARLEGSGSRVVLRVDRDGSAAIAVVDEEANILHVVDLDIALKAAGGDTYRHLADWLAGVLFFDHNPQEGSLSTDRRNIALHGMDGVIAIGRNAANTDDDLQGLQIGGGQASYGEDGVILNPASFASFLRLQPSKNNSPLEVYYSATNAAGIASKINSTSNFARVSGSKFKATWIGQKFYWDNVVYRVLSVASDDLLTVEAVAPSDDYTAGTLPNSGNAGGTFTVFYIEGTGICDVNLGTVTRVSGDPFLSFIAANDPSLTIDGSPATVVSWDDLDTITIVSVGTINGATYRFRGNINDRIFNAQFNKVIGDDAESLGIVIKPWEYVIRTNARGDGAHRSLVLSAGVDGRQVELKPDGSTVLTGPVKIRIGDVQAFADDTAAEAGGVPVGGLYRTASAIKIRVA